MRHHDPTAAPRAVLLTISVLVGVATLAPATVIHEIQYRPTSLPSAQGWAYVADDWHPEGEVFSLGDAALVLDTIGDGDGTCVYRRELPADSGVTHASGCIRARVLEFESEWSLPGSGALTFALTYGTPPGPRRYLMIVLSTDEVTEVSSGVSHGLDATVWHDYTLTMDLATGQYELLVDGVAVAQGQASAGPGDDRVAFGDAASPQNVRAEIGSVDIRLSAGGAVAADRRTWSGVKSLFAD